MRKIYPFYLLILLLLGCAKDRPSKLHITTEYYKAMDSRNFEAVKPLLYDTITTVTGEFVTNYTHNTYYELFKWDSVFNTTYEIVEMAEEQDEIIVTVASSSLRYEFLKNNPLTSIYKISFKADQISAIEVMDYIGADWNVWEVERDSLVSWTKSNHPELDGFIYDLSIQGAINYLRAMELYENRGASKLEFNLVLRVLAVCFVVSFLVSCKGCR